MVIKTIDGAVVINAGITVDGELIVASVMGLLRILEMSLAKEAVSTYACVGQKDPDLYVGGQPRRDSGSR